MKYYASKSTFLPAVLVIFFLLAEFSQSEEMEKDELGLLREVEKLEQLARTSQFRTKDLELEKKLNQISCKLSPDICAELNLYVLDLPGFNAFVLPNGAIFIQSGLLLRVKSESELAAVIGHEIVHYRNRHTIDSIRRRSSSAATFAVLGAFVGAAGNIAAAGATTPSGYTNTVNTANSAMMMLNMMQGFAVLALLDYDRDQEREADIEGVEMLSEAGFNPGAAKNLWLSYIEESEAGKSDQAASLLSTHPMPKERVRYLSEIQHNVNFDSENEDTSLYDIFNRNRLEWLSLEMRVLHPDQFSHLVDDQRTNWMIDYKIVNQYKGSSWIKYSKRQFLSQKEQARAKESALKIFKNAHESGNNITPSGYREWGMLAIELERFSEAKIALTNYLSLNPNAWDARFIEKKLAKM